MIDEAKLTEYYSQIANKLDEMIPCEWERVVLYAEETGSSSTAKFYFYTPDSVLHSSGTIEDEFQLDKQEHLNRLRALWQINRNLRQEFKDAEEELWYTYTFELDKDWHFKIKYGYEYDDNVTSMERGIWWAYDELGIIPKGKTGRRMLKKYLQEQGRELPPELQDEQETSVKKTAPVSEPDIPKTEEDLPIICSLTQEEIDYRKHICDMILEDEELHEYVNALFCMDFIKEQVMLSTIAEEYQFNMDGQVFAEDGGGGHYVFLEDGSIGYVNFAEGECGRVAENLKDMLELELNCAYDWNNYAMHMYYDDHEHLRKFVYGLEQDGRFQYEDAYGDEVPEYDELQKILAEKLGLAIYENIVDEVIIPFYKATDRKPEFKTVNPGKTGLNRLIH